MHRIYWDSCIFIYYLEAEEHIRLAVHSKLTENPNASLCHTALTELECRVGPLRDGKQGLLSQYERLFASPLTCRLPLDDGVYRYATELRAKHRLKTPDALHLASAIQAGCDSFWTRDNRLAKAALGHIQLIIPI